MHLLGLDCSDMRVHAVLEDAEGRVVGSESCALADAEEPGPALNQAIGSLLSPWDGADTTAVVCLPQGFRAEREALERLLHPLVQHCRRVWRCSPMEALAAGGLNGAPGVVVHCGLRAAAIGVHADGRVLTAGHADTALGDDGSALWLMVQLLRVVQQGLNGRTPRNGRVERSLASYFRTASFEDLLERVDAGQVLKSELAGFVSVMLELAAYPNPDPACRVLVLQAARHLIALVRYVIERSGFGEELPRGTWSGLALDGPLLAEFRRLAAIDIPEVTWQSPVHDAARGCALLARASAAQAPSAAIDPVTAAHWQALFNTATA